MGNRYSDQKLRKQLDKELASKHKFYNNIGDKTKYHILELAITKRKLDLEARKESKSIKILLKRLPDNEVKEINAKYPDLFELLESYD